MSILTAGVMNIGRNQAHVVECVRKAWISRVAPVLVEDGDPDACVLFARKGLRVPASHAARFENAADFFPALAKPAETVIEETKPKRRKGSPI